MKNLALLILSLSLFIVSCKNKQPEEEQSSNAAYESNDKFMGLVKTLNEKFTENAGYLSIMFTYDEVIGNTIMVKVSTDMTNDTIEEWYYMGEKWEKEKEIKLDTDSTKATEQLFSLTKDYDIKKLVNLVDKAKEKVKEEKQLEKVVCKSINLLMKSNNDSTDKMDNLVTQISIGTEDNGKNFSVNYDASGNFENLSQLK